MLVMQTNTHRYLKVPGEEFSGLYLADDFAPTVLLNGSDASSRRLFTLMHELTHLWLDEPGISRVEETAKNAPATAPIDKKTERFAKMSRPRFCCPWNCCAQSGMAAARRRKNQPHSSNNRRKLCRHSGESRKKTELAQKPITASFGNLCPNPSNRAEEEESFRTSKQFAVAEALFRVWLSADTSRVCSPLSS